MDTTGCRHLLMAAASCCIGRRLEGKTVTIAAQAALLRHRLTADDQTLTDILASGDWGVV